MKYIFLILTSIILLYSCNEEKTQENIIETREQTNKIEITDSNYLINSVDTINPYKLDKKIEESVGVFSCNYSNEQIGEINDKTAPVELIGLFENLTNKGESVYGYALMMWKLENDIIGFFKVYEGGVEPSRSGPLTFGQLTNDSLNLNIWTKQNNSFKDWQDSDVHIYSFNGLKSNNKIIGSFSLYNCTTEQIIENNDSQVELYSSDLWELKSFNNIKDWREAYSYDLNN